MSKKEYKEYKVLNHEIEKKVLEINEVEGQ